MFKKKNDVWRKYVASIVALYFGTFYRFVIKEKYKDYKICKATVISLEEYEYEDSDDNTYYHYSAELEYQIDKRVLQYFQETRIVNGAYTININGINESDIQPLNPIVKKMFSLTGTDRTS